jgi:hypothetical protein
MPAQRSRAPEVSPGAAGDPARLPTEPVVGQVEAFLEELVGGLEPDAAEAERGGRGRPRVLPALALWAGLLVCVLRGFSSRQALWRLLSGSRLWFYPRFPVSDEAVAQRLAAAGTAPLERLFEQVSALLAERLAPYQALRLAPFAAEVLALDETTLDRVARVLPALRGRPAGDPALLPGKLAGLFDLRRQQWRRVRHVPNPLQNEKVAARELVADLPRGSLLLADLGYFAFAWFDDLTDAGYWWVSRLRDKTSYTVQHVFYQDGACFDGIVWLGAHRADRAAHAVRLVQFTVGDQTWRYLTNVLDPFTFPPREIAAVYARRWDIELAFKLIKRHLGLHLLWAAKPDLVLQQVWAVLILSQILQALRLEVAGRAAVDPFEVSLPLLVEYFPRYAAAGQDPLPIFVEQGRALGFIRPSTRTRIVAPELPLDRLVPFPWVLALTRPPRYSPPHSGPHKSPKKIRPKTRARPLTPN